MKFCWLLVAAWAAGTVSAFAGSGNRPFRRPTSLNVVSEPPTTKVPVFDEVCETTGVTLKRFMTEVAMLNPDITELTTLFGVSETKSSR